MDHKKLSVFLLLLLLPLMTVSHKAGHYCHRRVLRSTNSDTGRKKEAKKRKRKKEREDFWNVLGGGISTFCVHVQEKMHVDCLQCNSKLSVCETCTSIIKLDHITTMGQCLKQYTSLSLSFSPSLSHVYMTDSWSLTESHKSLTCLCGPWSIQGYHVHVTCCDKNHIITMAYDQYSM